VEWLDRLSTQGVVTQTLGLGKEKGKYEEVGGELVAGFQDIWGRAFSQTDYNGLK